MSQPPKQPSKAAQLRLNHDQLLNRLTDKHGEVKFRHAAVTWKRNGKSQDGHATIAYIHLNDITIAAVSRCSPTDVWNRREGRYRAMKRLEKRFDQGGGAWAPGDPSTLKLTEDVFVTDTWWLMVLDVVFIRWQKLEAAAMRKRTNHAGSA